MILTRTRWKRAVLIAALGVMALLPDRVRPVRVAQPRQRPPLSDSYAKPAAGAAVEFLGVVVDESANAQRAEDREFGPAGTLPRAGDRRP